MIDMQRHTQTQTHTYRRSHTQTEHTEGGEKEKPEIIQSHPNP